MSISKVVQIKEVLGFTPSLLNCKGLYLTKP